EQNQSYPVSVQVFDDISNYAACVVEHQRGGEKAYKRTPVYIDPTDLFCKGVPVTYASLEKFLLKNFQNQMPYSCDVIGLTPYMGYTIELLKDRSTGAFTAVCMK